MVLVMNENFTFKMGWTGKKFRINVSPGEWIETFRPFVRLPMSNRSLLRHQLCHPQEIIGRTDKPSGQLGSVSSFESCLSESAHGFHPTENLFHSFSYPLTDLIAGVTGGPSIDGRSAFPFHVGGHMRGHLPAAEHDHKPMSVIPLIPAQGFGLD